MLLCHKTVVMCVLHISSEVGPGGGSWSQMVPYIMYTVLSPHLYFRCDTMLTH